MATIQADCWDQHCHEVDGISMTYWHNKETNVSQYENPFAENPMHEKAKTISFDFAADLRSHNNEIKKIHSILKNSFDKHAWDNLDEDTILDMIISLMDLSKPPKFYGAQHKVYDSFKPSHKRNVDEYPFKIPEENAVLLWAIISGGDKDEEKELAKAVLKDMLKEEIHAINYPEGRGNYFLWKGKGEMNKEGKSFLAISTWFGDTWLQNFNTSRMKYMRPQENSYLYRRWQISNIRSFWLGIRLDSSQIDASMNCIALITALTLSVPIGIATALNSDFWDWLVDFHCENSSFDDLEDGILTPLYICFGGSTLALLIVTSYYFLRPSDKMHFTTWWNPRGKRAFAFAVASTFFAIVGGLKCFAQLTLIYMTASSSSCETYDLNIHRLNFVYSIVFSMWVMSFVIML